MNTIHHGFWTYFIYRKRKTLVKYFVIGSLLPDVIYYVMFLYLGLSTGALFESNPIAGDSFPFHSLVHDMFTHPIVVVMRQAGHSIVVWAVLFGISYWNSRWRLTAWKSLLYGWLGHIIVDLLTHVEDAVPIFYPVSDIVIHGPISYWDPEFYGQQFRFVHMIFFVAAIIYLIYERITLRRKYHRS